MTEHLIRCPECGHDDAPRQQCGHCGHAWHNGEARASEKCPERASLEEGEENDRLFVQEHVESVAEYGSEVSGFATKGLVARFRSLRQRLTAAEHQRAEAVVLLETARQQNLSYERAIEAAEVRADRNREAAEVAERELAEEKARLDWLETALKAGADDADGATSVTSYWRSADKIDILVRMDDEDIGDIHARTLRAAIDAARSANTNKEVP
jgi:hypothetical protein